jgi:DNA-binding NarL/FixJ family response regulator
VAELRTLLRFALEEDGMQVVGQAGDGAAGVAVVRDTRPDVVILDLAMPGMDGLQAIPLMLEASPGTRIVVFSGFVAEGLADRVLAAGAHRYLEKGVALTEVADAVRELAAGA